MPWVVVGVNLHIHVLAAGGEENGQDSTSEIYSPISRTWAQAGIMTTDRILFQMVLLINGTVLAAGGESFNGDLVSSEVYDPATMTWAAATGDMTTGRIGLQMAVLADSTVLAAGGERTSDAALASSEVYDPDTGTWAATMGNMTTGRYEFGMVLLPNGMVLAAGGFINAEPDVPLASSEVYNTTTMTWAATAGSMTSRRAEFQMVVLHDGMVLAAGGDSNPELDGEAPLASSELYNPMTGIWTATGNMTIARTQFQMVVLSDGTVLAAGGTIGVTGETASSEVYNPVTKTWAETGNMTTVRTEFQMVALSDGTALAAGGAGGLSSSEVYDPATQTWAATATPMTTSRVAFDMVLLQS